MKYVMVIDQQNCVGCGGCILACKAENNTPADINWCDKITSTRGTFPNVSFEYISTMCNHCDNAPCVTACPTQAMYKNEFGLTLHNPDKCIGCKACMVNCPYGVISFNWQAPHREWQDESSLLAEGTFSPKGMLTTAGGEGSPHANPERGVSYPVLRGHGTVEKCTFCDHRLANGLEPACVEACPPRARIVGDIDDSESEVSKLIRRYNGKPLRPELGMDAKVFYIRSYSPARRN